MNAIVAERGQVTIPKRFRDRLGIGPRTLVDFEEEGGRLIMTKVVDSDPVARVTGCIRTGKRTDQIIRELRGSV